jgi:hypothetical protein
MAINRVSLAQQMVTRVRLQMIIRLVVALFALGILYCLGSAAYYLIRAQTSPISMLRALTWRVIASVVLFLLILLSYSMGWIEPHPAKFLLKLEAAQKQSQTPDREGDDGSALN